MFGNPAERTHSIILRSIHASKSNTKRAAKVQQILKISNFSHSKKQLTMERYRMQESKGYSGERVLTPEEEVKFWRDRSRGYNKLDWANRSNYLGAFIDACDFQPTDRVIDLGTGTGIIAAQAAPLVREVIGIDISPDMLDFACKEHSASNLKFHLGDIRSLDFEQCLFDKATARMVFHHVLTDAENGVRDVHRILAKEGAFILSEGVPPSKALGDWYSEMFALKEDRRTFFEDDLVKLVEIAPFKKIETRVHMVRNVSIRNWLENGAVSEENQTEIWKMHKNLNANGKAAYNMVEADDDIYLDMKFIILVATK